MSSSDSSAASAGFSSAAGAASSALVSTKTLDPGSAATRTYRKWSDQPMATASDGAASTSASKGFLTVEQDKSGGRKSRQRSMSAKKHDELRPHMDSISPKSGAGSVRLRRTSETVNEIGQLRLTPAQISLVRRVWQNVRVQGENGAVLQILRDHLFFRYPDIRELFARPVGGSAAGGGGGGSSSDTNYHKRLMAHAEALGGLLGEVIANVEHSEYLRDKIRELGRLHAKSRDVGFKAAYWDYLAEAFNECVLAWCQKAQRSFEAQVAMMTIVMFIIDHLKDGYMDECRKVRRSMYDSGSRDRSKSPRPHDRAEMT